MNKLRHTLKLLVAAVMTCVAMPSLAQMKVEYFIDEDPGFGKGKTVSAVVGANGEIDFDVSTLDLTPGVHTLGIRSYSIKEDGTAAFSPTITQVIRETKSHDLQCIEYFWDTDPGLNAATKIAIPAGAGLEYIANLDIPTDGVTNGHHTLGIRIYGDQGWSPTMMSDVTVVNTESARLQCIEFFWDTDPGAGNGTLVAIPTVAGNVYDTSFDVPTEGISSGYHKLGIRTYGGLGWSPTMMSDVMVKGTGDAALIGYAEYFWNEDPGYGKGTPIAIAKGMEVSVENLEVPSYLMGGACNLFVRAYGDQGWTPTVAFPVTVNCEGNYTLDSGKATDAEARNYQSMVDAMHDFSTRGVCDNITFNVTTTDTSYPLDLTAPSADPEQVPSIMEQLTIVADNMEQISTARSNKTLCFRSDNPSNSIDVTVAPENLKEAIRLFAHSQLDNVALRINGKAYDFTAIAQRFEETCGETSVHDATGIAEGIQMAWAAQPRTNNKITGFEAEGTGAMPEMMLTNTGTVLDSLTYAVTLTDAEGTELYAYNYNMYVHVKVSTKAFSGLTPTAGSSLNPVATTLKWNAIAGATKGYSLRITEKAFDSEAEPKETIVELDGTSYNLDVKSGYHYTWTVTAIGECDQLTSTEMNLDGRLLPDLQVAEISTPEYVEGGNQLTVTARIVNNGKGATTENTWTDRLYYTLNGTDFAQAVKVKDVSHSGNIEPDGSYTVEFTVNAPEAENGSLYYFVETDATGKVMESDNDDDNVNDNDNNNRRVSEEIVVNPFFVNENDLAALRKLYADYGGDNWSGSKWDLTTALIKSSNWSGITFDTEGYVTALNLQSRGLTGTMTVENGIAFPRLTNLNVSRNALKGDVAMLVKECPALTTLNAAYNQIDELSTPLGDGITSLDLSYQHRSPSSSTVWPGIEDVAVTSVQLGKAVDASPVAVLTYNHSAKDYTAHVNLAVFDKKYNRLGTLNWNAITEKYTFASNGWQLRAVQDMEVILEPASGTLHNSAYPATLHYTEGDVNINGLVDVNDVQRTLNYVINSNNSTAFHYEAANTFEDETINIQDIVSTVNIVLADTDGGSAAARVRNAQRVSRADDEVAMAYVEGGYICIDTEQEIAAIELDLQGVSAKQLRLMLDGTEWQMMTRNTVGGVRLMMFSPAGATLTNGRVRLLRFSGKATITAADASSPEAQSVGVGISDSQATGISGVNNDDNNDDNDNVYDLSGNRLSKPQRGINVMKGKKILK